MVILGVIFENLRLFVIAEVFNKVVEALGTEVFPPVLAINEPAGDY
jgi:hypothetical protein